MQNIKEAEPCNKSGEVDDSGEWSTQDVEVHNVPGPAWLPGNSRYGQTPPLSGRMDLFPPQRVPAIKKEDIPESAKLRWNDTIFDPNPRRNKKRVETECEWPPTPKQLTPPIEICRVCLRRGNKLCGICKLSRYCSATCQKKDWTEHKKTCVAPNTKNDYLDAKLPTGVLPLERH